MNFSARQTKLASSLRQAGLDAVLVTHLPNVRYLCGFSGTAGALLLQLGGRSHKSTFYTDGRYTQQAQEEVESAKVMIGKRATARARPGLACWVLKRSIFRSANTSSLGSLSAAKRG